MMTTQDPSHEPYQQAVAALQALLAAQGLAQVQQAYAEAVRTPKAKRFAAGREPAPQRQIDFHHLAGDACDQRRCSGAFPLLAEASFTAWQKEGKTDLIVMQTPQLDHASLQAVLKFCHEHDIELDLSVAESWLAPGATLCVQFRSCAFPWD